MTADWGLPVGTATWLMVSPTQSGAEVYCGCLLLRVTSLETASVARNAGKPVVEASIAQHGDFNGACGYVPGLAANGVLVSQARFNHSIGLWKSYVQPPQ